MEFLRKIIRSPYTRGDVNGVVYLVGSIGVVSDYYYDVDLSSYGNILKRYFILRLYIKLI